jgi:hypothetical protein
VAACARPRPCVQVFGGSAAFCAFSQLTIFCDLAAKKTSAGTAVPSTEPLDADAATWTAVESTHGSLAACALAHVQALAAASAAAAVRCGGVGDSGNGCR